MRILSGIQSSGKQHIGNYYGALRQFVDLQNRGDEALYFIANLHALTSIRDPAQAAALTRETAMAFLALGLDPRRAILFRQSDIPEVTELYWILGTVVPLSNLDRAHSYKDKLARGLPADFGLFAYPVLMAADILLYGSEMSKSYNNIIELFGDEAEVKKRIMGIKTDSTPVGAPKPVDTPLHQLLRVMLPENEFAAVDASWRQGGKGYGEYKKTLLAAYHATFGEARARYQALQKDPGSVDAILRAGAERARAVAAPVIGRVRQAVGIER